MNRKLFILLRINKILRAMHLNNNRINKIIVLFNRELNTNQLDVLIQSLSYRNLIIL